MQLKDIISILTRDFPHEAAVDWDNVGLLVGDPAAEISTILLSLDASDAAVTKAVEEKADLILTHHPLIFEPLKKVTEDNFLTRRIRRMIKADIQLYAMHTNFDILKMGELNARDLGLQFPAVLEEVGDGSREDFGFGKIGMLAEAMTLADFAARVKETMGLSYLRVYGDPAQMVQKVAVSSGAGRSGIPYALAKSADVMVTGDLSYHAAIDANAAGLAMIDAGHYGTESVFIDYMKDYLADRLPDVKVICVEKEQPYKIV